MSPPPRWPVLLALFAFALPMLTGCTTPDTGGHRVDVSSSYNAAATPPDDVEKGPRAGSTANGGIILVHVVADEAWVEYREFVDSGLADFTIPPHAQRGDLLVLGKDGGAARYQFTLDAQGRTDFRVADGLWVRLEMSGGHATFGDCEASYTTGEPLDARADRALTLAVPYGIACRTTG